MSQEEKVSTVADALSRLDIVILKIQEEEEVLTLLSGSENSSISNIKYTIPMHIALTEKTIRNTMTWSGLTQDVEYWLLPTQSNRFIKYILGSWFVWIWWIRL
jgi:hypothetical protein